MMYNKNCHLNQLSVHFSDINHIYIVVQPSPLSIYKIFHPPKTETLPSKQ